MRAARGTRVSFPAAPASARPAPALRVPSPAARPPAVLFLASSLRSLSVGGGNGGAAQLALPMFNARLERALHGRESLSNIAARVHLARSFSAASPARHDGAQRSLLCGASVRLAPRFGDRIGMLVHDVGHAVLEPWVWTRRSLSTASKVSLDAEPAVLPAIKDRQLGKMPFVDRDEEAMEIAVHNIANAYNARSQEIKPTLVSSSQLYGAGKSAMGANAVARVRGSEELRERLVTSLKPSLNIDHQTAVRLVEDYANAVTVVIDLRHQFGQPHAPTLSALLVCQLHWALGQQPELQDKDAWANLYPGVNSFEALVHEFHKRTRRNVFIHFDEVAALLNSDYDQYFSDRPSSIGDSELEEVRRFHYFWNQVEKLLRLPNAYMFITGKSAGFSLIGLQRYREYGITSPTDFHYLLLGALSSKDIAELCKSVTVGSLPLRRYVHTATPALLELLCERLHAETVGLPRLVQYYLAALCQLQVGPYVLRSPADVDAAIARARKLCIDRKVLGPSLTGPTSAAPELAPALQELLEAALFGRLLREKHQIALSTGKPMEVVALINRLGLYAVRVGADRSTLNEGALLQLRLPPATVHFLLTSELSLPPRLKVLLSLSDEPLEKLDQGVLLEFALRVRLAVSLRDLTAIHAHATWAEALPVLASTWAAQVRIELPTNAREDKDLWQTLPRVLAARGPALMRTEPIDWEALDENMWAVSIGKTDWSQLLKREKFRPVVGKIFYFRVQSHSPDVIVFASDNLVIAFQPKFTADPLTVKELQEECNKTAYLIGKVPQEDVDAAEIAAKERAKALDQARYPADKQALEKLCDVFRKLRCGTDGWYMLPGPHSHEQVVLVIASWHLGAQLQNAMRGKDMVVLDAGMWNKELQRTSDRQECKVDVPEGMQLVLLGRVGMQQLLGTAAQLVLDKILEAKNNPELSRLSSIELYRGSRLTPPVFNLESFLRDEAKIDAEGVIAYLPLLRKKKVTEAKLRLLTDALLLKWGIEEDLDRAAILDAAQKHTAGRQGGDAGRV